MATGNLDTTAAPGTGGSGPPTGTTNQQKSASATLQATLQSFGLGSLANWAWQKYINGENVSQIMLDLRNTPAYKQRFPAMAYLSQHGMAVTEQAYINLEQSYSQQFASYGIPGHFFNNPSDFAKLIERNITPDQLGQRLALRAQVVLATPPDVRARLAQAGWDVGHLTAFMVDPKTNLPKLEQQFLAAQIGGAADQTGYTGVSEATANQLAQQGITPSQAQQGFSQLASQQDLFAPLPGTSEDQIGQHQQIAAAFSGDALAQRDINRRQQQRKATFGGSSQFASSQQGFSGVGAGQGA